MIRRLYVGLLLTYPVTIEPTEFDDSTFPDVLLVKTDSVFDVLPAVKITAPVRASFDIVPLFVIDKPFPKSRIPVSSRFGFNAPLLIKVLGSPGNNPNFQSPTLLKPSDMPVQVMTPAVVIQSANAVVLNERIVEAKRANLIGKDCIVVLWEAGDDLPEGGSFITVTIARLIDRYLMLLCRVVVDLQAYLGERDARKLVDFRVAR